MVNSEWAVFFNRLSYHSGEQFKALDHFFTNNIQIDVPEIFEIMGNIKGRVYFNQ